VSSQADPRLHELCDLAAAAAERKGHDLGEWEDDRASDVHARRTTCRRCGRAVYVRLGDGMTGMAGAALTERCD
jgi:hypothetical protein